MALISSKKESRLTLSESRQVSEEVANEVFRLHADGKFALAINSHNVVYNVAKDLNRHSKESLYHVWGKPKQEPLTTFNGEKPGPEAPRYIVKPLDMLSSEPKIYEQEASLIRFNQSLRTQYMSRTGCFPAVAFHAPELATGTAGASRSSDVWALGCVIFECVSGNRLFPGVLNHAQLIYAHKRTLGNPPAGRRRVYFDKSGRWTNNESESVPLHEIYKETPFLTLEEKIEQIQNMPKKEKALFFALMSRIFIYDPAKRLTAEEVLHHRWIHLHHRKEPDIFVQCPRNCVALRRAALPHVESEMEGSDDDMALQRLDSLRGID